MEELVISHLKSGNPVNEAAQIISSTWLSQKLFDKNVVILISGGSCIALIKEILTLLPDTISLSSVKFALADERFVQQGDDESNATQMRKAGVIELIEKYGSQCVEILSTPSNSKEEVANEKNQQYEELLKSAEKVVMLAGMGSDGHTAGMLPNTSQEFEIFHHDRYLVGYTISPSSDNPHKERLTISMHALSFVDTVYLFATGKEKEPALKNFIAKNKPLHELPVLTLYLSQQPIQLLTDIEV